MRKSAPALTIAAVAAAGLLWASHPKAADAQTAVVPATVTVPLTETVFVSGGVDYDKTKGTEASKPVSVSFPGRQVQSAEVVLKGFDVQYLDAEHPVHQVKVKFDNVQSGGEAVKFDAHVLIRDNSGDIDDPYTGHVDYVVIARVK